MAGVCALIVVKHAGEHQADDSAGGTLAEQDVSETRRCSSSPRSPLGPRTAPNRIMFGPHVTNLGGDDRSLTARHVAYYERRAAGGCGTVVIEGASVHGSDWPYERAPLAERCAAGWRVRGGGLPAARVAGDRLARPCRRAGIVGLQPGAVVGAVAGAGDQHPRGAEVDGGRRHRRGDRRVPARGQAGGRCRPRRRRDQRRPAQPGPPVPERAHQPTRRRVGPRPAAVRPRGDRRDARSAVGADRVARAAAVVRRARAVGRDHARHGARHRPQPWPVPASTTWS